MRKKVAENGQLHKESGESKRKHRSMAGVGKLISGLFLAALLAGALPGISVKAAPKTLTLEQAKAMALFNSSDYTMLQNKRDLAQIQYVQAVKSIQLKEKNQRTFRWSPLLDFKFPEKPDLSDSFEYTYKPLELQSQIDSLDHELQDRVFGIYEEASLQYMETYMLQEKIAYNERLLASYEDTLERNKARLLLGEAKQADVDGMENKVNHLKNALAADKRSFEAAKEKLSGILGMEAAVSYRFQSAFTEAEISRGDLNSLIDYTLEHNHTLYKAELAASNALLAMDTNYDLMRSQYGSKMNVIDSFVNQARRGEKLDSAAFRMSYDRLLADVDSPWQGSIRILFIKIPKEWFKGEIDGIRYVEDEPYVLYEAALEYQNLRTEADGVRADLTAQVKESYENYVSAKNTWKNLVQSVAAQEKALQEAALLNSLGEMTYEEYALIQQEYEDLQMEEMDSLAAYSEILFTFDRLTCGGVTRMLSGTAMNLTGTEGGQSYVVEEEGGDGVYYYIHLLVEGNIFEFGLSIPDDYEAAITEYELWVNGEQVGDRISADQPLRHLALDLENVDRVFVRLYGDGEFIDDCDIDPSLYSGKLSITTGYRIETPEKSRIASYTMEINGVTGLLELTIKPEAEEEAIAGYRLMTEDGSYLMGDAMVDIGQPFRYLQVAGNSLEELTIQFYDEGESLLYEASFRTSDRTVHKKE